MRFNATTLVILGCVVGIFSACGDDTPAEGTEGGPCYANDTCNRGLTCLSNLCVAAGNAGSSSGVGGGGNGGSGSGGKAGGASGGKGGTGSGGKNGTGAGRGGTGQGEGGESGAVAQAGKSARGGTGGTQSPSDGGESGGGDQPNVPTHGGLRVSWTFTDTSSNMPGSCAALAAQAGGPISVAVTATNAMNPSEIVTDQFDCEDGEGDTRYDFGAYSISVALLDGQDQVIAQPAPVDVTLGPSPCDEIVQSTCLRNLPLKFAY